MDDSIVEEEVWKNITRAVGGRFTRREKSVKAVENMSVNDVFFTALSDRNCRSVNALTIIPRLPTVRSRYQRQKANDEL
jgi:hypothetical protein